MILTEAVNESSVNPFLPTPFQLKVWRNHPVTPTVSIGILLTACCKFFMQLILTIENQNVNKPFFTFSFILITCPWLDTNFSTY